MPQVPKEIDPREARAIRAGIEAAGGLAAMAKVLGFRTTERVRRFYAFGTRVSAEKARAFVKAARGVVTLRQIRPDLYDKLTVEELGYQPRAKGAK